MDGRLRMAAEEGHTDALYECIRHDPNVLRRFDEIEFVDTPLHVAASKGHAIFAMAIMNLKPSLSRKLNQDIYSPIHLALQNGHETTVRRLLEADRDLVRVKGKEGYTVLHQAVQRGNLQLLAEFLMTCPASVEDVTNQNETAFHIAAKTYRLETVKLLGRWFQRSQIYWKVSRKHLLNSKDAYGNTALHTVAFSMHTKLIKILVECGADRMVTDMNGLKALDIVENERTINTQEKDLILKILDNGTVTTTPQPIKPLHEFLSSKISFGERLILAADIRLLNLSADRVNLLLVVLAILLTTAFQSVYSPPGGVWQGDPSQATSAGANYTLVGQSIMSPLNFSSFYLLNWLVVSITSLIMIFLLEFIAVGSVIMVIVEILLSSFISCFAFAAISVLYPSVERESNGWAVEFVVIITCFLVMETSRRMLRSRLGNLGYGTQMK